MKKRSIQPVLILIVFLMTACGQSSSKNETNNKQAPETESKDSPAATSVVTPESAAPEPGPETNSGETKNTAPKPKTAAPATKGSPAQTRGLDIDTPAANSEILAQIDKYLVSSVQFSPNPAGGFSNAVVTVTNTLSHAGFQKALLEVSILNEDGSLVRSDYYTVINIESSGGSKIVKLPESKTGKKISTHIMKVKSEELTKGEFVLTGNH